MVNKLDSLVPKVLRSKTDDNYSSSVEFPSKALLDILTNNNQSIFLQEGDFIGDHLFYSRNLYVWFRDNILQIN